MDSKTAVTTLAIVNEYMRGQAQILKAPSFKVVQAGQLRSLIKTLSTCARILVDDEPAIMNELNNGNWDDAHKEMIGTAIDKLVVVGQTALTHSVCKKAQRCDHIEKYLTDTDFSKILSQQPGRTVRYEACSAIFNHLKMPNPDPQTKRRMIAIMSSADACLQNPTKSQGRVR